MVRDLRHIACVLLHDDYGINSYGWELLEEALLRQDINDVSKCVKESTEGRWYITEVDFIRLVVP